MNHRGVFEKVPGSGEQEGSSAPARRARGAGRIWKIGRIYWIQFYCRGRRVRESSHSDRKLVAERLLRQRLTALRSRFTPEAESAAWSRLLAPWSKCI